MPSTSALEEEQVQNGNEVSDDDEVDETGKIDDTSDGKAKKKRKKKKKNKTPVTADGDQTDPVASTTEAVATISIQQD
ncbi:unnamed protein product, partial [Adineta steineri]